MALDFQLYDLRVTVVSIEGRAVCGLQVGDYFELTESSRLRLPPDKHFCIYALASVIPFLAAKQREGWQLFAWNGLSFDLRWIGYNAGDMESAAKVALGMYDPMFQFFNQRGFPVGLAAVGEAMGVRQTKLMNAADAPREWRKGNHQKVMEYVVGDCQITNQIVAAIANQGRVSWRTRAGTLSSEPMPRLKTVAEVLREPEPDQSWMKGPGLRRTKFTEWLPAHLARGG